MSKRKKIKDPNAVEEAQKYDNPIPSRAYIMEYLQERGSPATREELAEVLLLSSDEQLEALRRRLRAMERDGQLAFNRRGGYGLVDKMNLLAGRVIGHRDGYGFVVPDDSSADLFLNARQMRAVFDGDRVLVRIAGVDRKGRREADLVEVIERKTHYVAGRFVVEDGVSFVRPDNKRISQDIIVAADKQGTAVNGQMVIVEILTPPTLRSQAIARVHEILGEHMAPGMEIDVSIRSHALPHIWPDAVLHQIAEWRGEVAEVDKRNRIDLRSTPLVTIDGEDAQDFDDAVYCEARPQGGWRLLVAIADVSHYVQPECPLDLEAKVRGNSVYFPGQVIPMLPEILSNQLCSLKPHVDRLCMVCEMTISADGKLMRHRFYDAVMHSAARLTYTEVADMLVNNDKRTQKRYQTVLPHLEELYRLYQVFLQRRHQRGAIDFDTIETRVVFGEGRKIKEIIPVQRNDAHRLIEECMIMANVAAAKEIAKHKIPGLYRVHEPPSAERITEVRKFLTELGLSLGSQKSKIPQPGDYSVLMQSVEGRPDSHLIQMVLLRSLSQATYSPHNKGHFGLAFPNYAHFTSPIRRYPDLLLHRAIRHILLKKPVEEFPYSITAIESLGGQCSQTERRADEATRDALDWLKCEYMLDRVGEEFPGIITKVTGFGLFVELKDIYVEGLLHVTALQNDYYRFDPVRHRLTGERTGVSYRPGDSLRVKVVRVSLDDKKIDFELVAAKRSGTAKQGASKQSTSKKGDAAKRESTAKKSNAAKEKAPRKRRKKPVKVHPHG